MGGVCGTEGSHHRAIKSPRKTLNLGMKVHRVLTGEDRWVGEKEKGLDNELAVWWDRGE